MISAAPVPYAKAVKDLSTKEVKELLIQQFFGNGINVRATNQSGFRV
jgi:hypothetical protein